MLGLKGIGIAQGYSLASLPTTRRYRSPRLIPEAMITGSSTVSVSVGLGSQSRLTFLRLCRFRLAILLTFSLNPRQDEGSPGEAIRERLC